MELYKAASLGHYYFFFSLMIWYFIDYFIDYFKNCILCLLFSYTELNELINFLNPELLKVVLWFNCIHMTSNLRKTNYMMLHIRKAGFPTFFIPIRINELIQIKDSMIDNVSGKIFGCYCSPSFAFWQIHPVCS